LVDIIVQKKTVRYSQLEVENRENARSYKEREAQKVGKKDEEELYECAARI